MATSSEVTHPSPANIHPCTRYSCPALTVNCRPTTTTTTTTTTRDNRSVRRLRVSSSSSPPTPSPHLPPSRQRARDLPAALTATLTDSPVAGSRLCVCACVRVWTCALLGERENTRRAGERERGKKTRESGRATRAHTHIQRQSLETIPALAASACRAPAAYAHTHSTGSSRGGDSKLAAWRAPLLSLSSCCCSPQRPSIRQCSAVTHP